jgi:hypothetical protein
LSAAISAADVSAAGDHLVTVWDPSPAPGGTLTAPKTLRVLPTVLEIYFPFVWR